MPPFFLHILLELVTEADHCWRRRLMAEVRKEAVAFMGETQL